MKISIVDGISTLISVTIVVLAIREWQILRDRHLILSTIGTALKERKSLWVGVLVGVLYLATFMVFGGKGGRIHLLFGRLVLNATTGEILMGLVLAVLVTISTALFFYGVHAMGLSRSKTKGGIGIAGAFLALLACFCP
jgi:hypothetical protein